MSKVSINPADASFAIPKGTYTVLVQSVVQKEPKKEFGGQHAYLETSFIVVEPEAFANRTFSDRLSLSPKARARLASFAVACGVVGKDAQGNFELDTEEFKGKVLIVTGEPEMFKSFEQFRPQRFEMHPSTAQAIEQKMSGAKPQPDAEQRTAGQSGSVPPPVPVVPPVKKPVPI